jgi:FtsP/CotA-like multicopper oxidase with cupredoxin domain
MPVRNIFHPLDRTVLTLAGIALSLFLPAAGLQAQTCPGAGPAFTPVGEIQDGSDGVLRAVMKVVSGKRTVPGSDPLMLRYFEGYNQTDPSQKWPLTDKAGPGPTLRMGATDIVNITLLNQVKVEDFGGTLDSGEKGSGTGCDETTRLNANGTINVKNFYPADDKFPNCFHGSSSANLHFHGAHVTPSTTGDNVLVNVRPNAKVTEKDVKASFAKIFEHCALGHQPQHWDDLPQEWRDFQESLLKEYDATAPYVGPGKNPDGHGLPPNQQLWPQNQSTIDQGLWPQWYVGSYPYCFQFPKYEPGGDLRMGQAPGTHWYHSHKHGSTSLNLFNGLAGAMILTDNSPTGYDGKLRAFYGGKLEEKVIILQQITSALNLQASANRNVPLILVNGDRTPTITMQPGQVQLWRIVNATVASFLKGATFQPAGGITFKQTAQDGVQLAWENYSNSQNGTDPIEMSPANRVDMLVQAPTSPGCYTWQDSARGTILYVNVTGTAVAAKGFPTQEGDYPKIPEFLKDIDPANIHIRRDITYGSRAKETPPAGERRLTQFTIDKRKFEDQHLDQLMELDTDEEWTIYNTDDVAVFAKPTEIIGHPFHIHVNPFQIFEIYDPTTMDKPLTLPPPYVWWDTFPIPLAKVVPEGTPGAVKVNDQYVLRGYFKMRTRFVDFTGEFVQHCHILAHEDRGMMQLLEVASNKTKLKHH